jgi:hypothetical protein
VCWTILELECAILTTLFLRVQKTLTQHVDWLWSTLTSPFSFPDLWRAAPLSHLLSQINSELRTLPSPILPYALPEQVDPMAQWSPPWPGSRFGCYHSAHGRSGPTASDLNGVWQHGRRKDAVTVGMRQGSGMVPWLWPPASAARVRWRTYTCIDRWATRICLCAF